MVDRYTKLVLTVIAGALVVLAAQNGLNFARAAVGYNDVCGAVGHPACQVVWTTPMPVNVVTQETPQSPPSPLKH
jgi:hypothetical protein